MLMDASGGRDFDDLEEAAVESMLALGALPDVAASVAVLDYCDQARKCTSSLDEVARLGGAPVTRQCTRNVIAEDFLDAGRGDDYMGDSPDATVHVDDRGERKHRARSTEHE